MKGPLSTSVSDKGNKGKEKIMVFTLDCAHPLDVQKHTRRRRKAAVCMAGERLEGDCHIDGLTDTVFLCLYFSKSGYAQPFTYSFTSLNK